MKHNCAKIIVFGLIITVFLTVGFDVFALNANPRSLNGNLRENQIENFVEKISDLNKFVKIYSDKIINIGDETFKNIDNIVSDFATPIKNISDIISKISKNVSFQNLKQNFDGLRISFDKFAVSKFGIISNELQNKIIWNNKQ